jgi:uncharacterized RmlC-like cupin family protein
MRDDSPPSCQVFRAGETYAGKQGFDYFSGISAESAGSRGLCMHLLTIPPGGRAKAHMHRSHETAIYVLAGEGEMWHGPGSNTTWSCAPATCSTSPPACRTCR